jgi:hypothetical protein
MHALRPAWFHVTNIVYVIVAHIRVPVKHKHFMLASGEYINYVDIMVAGTLSADEADNAPTLVLTHGFGSGVAFFFGETCYVDCMTNLLSNSYFKQITTSLRDSSRGLFRLIGLAWVCVVVAYFFFILYLSVIFRWFFATVECTANSSIRIS